jgi:hypothetical protein
LQVAPEFGRTFTVDDDQPGGHRVAILSHGLWARCCWGVGELVAGRQGLLTRRFFSIFRYSPASVRRFTSPLTLCQ